MKNAIRKIAAALSKAPLVEESVRKKALNYIVFSVLTFVVISSIILGLTISVDDVTGANMTNATVTTRVNISNTKPELSEVFVTPSTIDLNAGNITKVNCTGYVFDYDGWQDITFFNVTFFDVTTSSSDAQDDKNDHYTNTSCSCVERGGSPTNGTCTCTFDVWYFANNGSWMCNMTIGDDTFQNQTKNSSTVTVNTVLGIGVPDEIDYGDLSVTETSDFFQANISNWGNVPINVTIRGWGGLDDYGPSNNGTALICSLGNISSNLQKYSLNTSVLFDDMTNMTHNATMIPNFQLPVRTNDTNYGNDTNSTFWKLYIPLTVGGQCNGTLEFGAVQTNI